MSVLIDKLAWIEVQERRFLSTRTRGRSLFYIPGGKREPGETDIEALCREVTEELSVRITPDSVAPFGVFEALADPLVHEAGVKVRMTCFTARYSGNLKPAAEIDEMRWLSSSDASISSPVDRLIIAELVARGWID